MALSNSARLAVAYVPEATFGTVPASTGGYPRALRVTGESLNYALKKDWSKEIRSDRQKADLVTVDADSGGSLPFELSYGEYDDMFQASLFGTWSEINNTGTITCTITLTSTITASAGTPFANLAAGMKVKFTGFANAANNAVLTILTASATVLTVSNTLVNESSVSVSASSGGVAKGTATFTTTTVTFASGSPFANVVAGQWVNILGAANAANNGWFKVVSKTSSVLTFAASTFTAEASTANVYVSGRRCVNGTTQRSFSIEELFADVTQFVTHRGMTPNKLMLDFKIGAILTGSIDFTGKDQLPLSGTTNLNGTTVASLTNDVMNSATGIANILENGAALSTTFVRSMSIEVGNNLRAQKGLGTLGNVGVGYGHVDVMGKLEVYFSDATLYNKFINNTSTSLSLRIQDASLNGYVITIPKVRYSTGDLQAAAIDQDGVVSLSFEGVYDATSGYTILIDEGGVQPM